MAREGITFEQVAAAADAILGEGHQPTIRALRDRLGTGSPNTIHRHLNDWRAAKPQAVANSTVLPPSLMNAIAAELARAAVQARFEIEGKLVQMQAEAGELAQAGEVLESERDNLVSQVADLTTANTIATATATERQIEVNRLIEVVHHEQQAAELARIKLVTVQTKVEQQQERHSEQLEEIQRLRDALVVGLEGKVAAEQKVAVLTVQLEAERTRSVDLAERLKEVGQIADKSNRDAEKARIAEQAVQARLESAAREIEAKEVRINEFREDSKKLKEQLAAVTAQLKL